MSELASRFSDSMTLSRTLSERRISTSLSMRALSPPELIDWASPASRFFRLGSTRISAEEV
ncbi:hypothetical protein D3C86_2255020 [compost metagenome]